MVHESHCPEIGPICDQRPEPPQLHDQHFNIVEMRLAGEYGITDRIGAELQFPIRISNTQVEYQRLDGTPFVPDYPNIHHQNETLFGPGDPWLLGRVAGRLGAFTATGRAGLSLPLGSTEPNPFELGEMGLVHQHVQFGTGTFNPVLAGDLSRGFGDRVHGGVHGQAQLMLYENQHGYRAGSRYAAGVQVRARATGKLDAALGLDLVKEKAERWDGVILQDGNLGRTDLLLGAAATYQIGRFSVTGAVKVPVYQDIVQTGDEAAQLSYPAIIELTVQSTFELTGAGRSR